MEENALHEFQIVIISISSFRTRTTFHPLLYTLYSGFFRVVAANDKAHREHSIYFINIFGLAIIKRK